MKATLIPTHTPAELLLKLHHSLTSCTVLHFRKQVNRRQPAPMDHSKNFFNDAHKHSEVMHEIFIYAYINPL